MSQRYVQVLAAAGAVPWVIPLLQGDEATLRAIYERLDGLFLPGGVDVDPSAYGEPRGPLCGRTDPARDWTELLFLRCALADRKPVLAVCRGAQLVNVAVGGSLYQDVAAQHPAAIKHDHFPLAGRPDRRCRGRARQLFARSAVAPRGSRRCGCAHAPAVRGLHRCVCFVTDAKPDYRSRTPATYCAHSVPCGTSTGASRSMIASPPPSRDISASLFWMSSAVIGASLVSSTQ